MKPFNPDKWILIGILLMAIVAVAYLFFKPIHSIPYIAITTLLFILLQSKNKKK
ncbi:hypothetical protein RFK57_10330 [Streptococcus suis]|uniref:hypothetical protein n=1 Tax=Streptococcus suis TaxID=1307 RepID=UPI002FC799F3